MRQPRALPSRRAVLAGIGAVPAAVLAGALSACTGGLGQPASDVGNQQGYVGGDGTVRWVAPGKRTDAVALSGTTTDGTSVSVADWRGELVVVNVWYASCAPCRTEAPHLAEIATATPDVHFLGINTRDDAAAAQAFEKKFKMPYPSLLDASTGAALLALRGTIPPQAVPSTVVLDTEGRPAARVVGRVEPDVLEGLIQSVRTGRLDGRATA